MNRPMQVREVLVYVLSLLKDAYPYGVAALVVALLFLLHVPDEILIALAAVLVVGVLVFLRYQNYKKLKQRTYESLSPEMKMEIDQERRVNIGKRQKFLDAMSKASGEGSPFGGSGPENG